jgi:hypothetical protein
MCRRCATVSRNRLRGEFFQRGKYLPKWQLFVFHFPNQTNVSMINKYDKFPALSIKFPNWENNKVNAATVAPKMVAAISV